MSLGNWCVLNKCSFCLSFSFPFPRSFPSLSLCQKSTANSKSSFMLVWNTVKTYTSGTRACRLSEFGFKCSLVNHVNVQPLLEFQTFGITNHLAIAKYYTIPIWILLIFFFVVFFCHYFLCVPQSYKQTNRFSLPDFFPFWQGDFVLLQLAHMRKHNTTMQQSRPLSVPYSVAGK